MARHDANSFTLACPAMKLWDGVTKTGNKVKKFKEGDIVVVGCMVDPAAHVLTVVKVKNIFAK
jgi:hypothetical protein